LTKTISFSRNLFFLFYNEQIVVLAKKAKELPGASMTEVSLVRKSLLTGHAGST